MAKWLDGSRCHWVWKQPRPKRHCVRRGKQLPSQQGQSPYPIFGPSIVAKRLHGMEVGLVLGHIVLDGDAAPPVPKRAQSPQFSAHVCCGQTAGWIKMPLGTKVGLRPGRIVLHGTQLPLAKGAQPPIFGPCLLWPNGRLSQLLLSTCSV